MKKKTIALALALVLVFGATMGGTFAYLTMQTDTITNTFTVGNVSFGDKDGKGALDEAKVNEYGMLVNGEGLTKEEYVAIEGNTEDGWKPADRVTGNEYKLMPGATYTKDPTVHIAAGSEECWLFVKVENGIEDIEAEGKTTIAAQMAANWTALVVNGKEVPDVYYYKTKVDASAEQQNITIFSSFTLAEDADVVFDEKVEGDVDYSKEKITIQAYAVQAYGFENALDAWDKAPLEAWTTSAE